MDERTAMSVSRRIIATHVLSKSFKRTLKINVLFIHNPVAERPLRAAEVSLLHDTHSATISASAKCDDVLTE